MLRVPRGLKVTALPSLAHEKLSTWACCDGHAASREGRASVVPERVTSVMSIKPDFGTAGRFEEWHSSKGLSVAVIIPTYNHAQYLIDAISSAIAQTRPADEIIVVDDGSTDNPATVVRRFPGVRFIQQENRGRSAARNAGLRTSTSSHVVFLDADDRLLPNALEDGLSYAAEHPGCAFIYGAHRDITEREEGGKTHYSPISGDAQLALMRRNLIRMQAAAVFRRDCLIEIGGYDETLQRAEDYDLYLRLSRIHPAACHPKTVAEYRWHGRNTSDDIMRMLRATLKRARSSRGTHRTEGR